MWGGLENTDSDLSPAAVAAVTDVAAVAAAFGPCLPVPIHTERIVRGRVTANTSSLPLRVFIVSLFEAVTYKSPMKFFRLLVGGTSSSSLCGGDMIMMMLLLLLASTLPTTTHAWILPSVTLPTTTTTTPRTRLYNIPPPATTDRPAFQQYANKQPPPSSFFELQQDCIRSAALAIQDGELLIEVEFPPLPANVLELDDVSAYDVASANLNLAIDFAKGMILQTIPKMKGDNNDNDNTIQNVAIMLPDEDEARIAIERRSGRTDQYIAPTVLVESGVTISSLRRSDESDDRLIKVHTKDIVWGVPWPLSLYVAYPLSFPSY